MKLAERILSKVKPIEEGGGASFKASQSIAKKQLAAVEKVLDKVRDLTSEKTKGESDKDMAVASDEVISAAIDLKNSLENYINASK